MNTYKLKNMFEVKCFICKNSIEDDEEDFTRHVSSVHDSMGLTIEAFCEKCDIMFNESIGKFSLHMKNVHNKNVNEKMLRSALMLGKITAWSSNTIKSENEADGKIVHRITREIETKKIIHMFICCDATILNDGEDFMNHMEIAHADGDENISSDDDDVHLKEASGLIDEIDTIKEEANFNVDWQNSPEVIEQRGNSIVDTQKQSAESTQILPCEKCDYSSEFPSNLKRHKNNVHNSENAKVFTCKKCDYSSKNRSGLKRHKNNVHDSENAEVFTCEKCDYSSKSRGGLKRHKNNVHDSENANVFTCEKCVYSSKLEFNLKRHKNNVHDSENAEVFPCEKCVYSSKFKSDLKRHMEKKH